MEKIYFKCENCHAEWWSPDNLRLKNCPFCHIDTRSDSEIMVEVVEKYTSELYNNPHDFNDIIREVYGEKRIGDLLKILVNNDASKIVFELQNSPTDELEQSVKNIVEQIEYKTFLPTYITTPAINLLCYGLGSRH